MYKNLFLNPLIVPIMKKTKSFAFNQVKDFDLYPLSKKEMLVKVTKNVTLPNDSQRIVFKSRINTDNRDIFAHRLSY